MLRIRTWYGPLAQAYLLTLVHPACSHWQTRVRLTRDQLAWRLGEGPVEHSLYRFETHQLNDLIATDPIEIQDLFSNIFHRTSHTVAQHLELLGFCLPNVPSIPGAVQHRGLAWRMSVFLANSHFIFQLYVKRRFCAAHGLHVTPQAPVWSTSRDVKTSSWATQHIWISIPTAARSGTTSPATTTSHAKDVPSSVEAAPSSTHGGHQPTPSSPGYCSC
jgi:hypothetical protein